jgi:hypothetical protein
MSKDTKKPKFQFGAAPDSFKREVEVINIHGAESTIEVEFVYRTKTQFAALADEGLRDAKAKLSASKDGEEDQFTIEKISSNFYSEANSRTTKEGAEYVMKIAKAWDISEPLSVDSLMKLEDQCAGALQSIATIYAKAINEVRTKN